jgi:hypothetical protein
MRIRPIHLMLTGALLAASSLYSFRASAEGKSTVKCAQPEGLVGDLQAIRDGRDHVQQRHELSGHHRQRRWFNRRQSR